jgi:hypothetical protein
MAAMSPTWNEETNVAWGQSWAPTGIVKDFAFVELGVAHSGGVAAQPADPLNPGLVGHLFSEVVGVGAVDHEVGGRVVGRLIHRCDGVRECFAGGQVAVSFHRERDHHRQAAFSGRTNDTNCLVRVGEGQCSHHVDVSFR